MSRIAKIMFMLVGLALVANSPIAAQETPAKQPRPKASAKKAPPAKPVPDAANVSYGPHERNVLDLWLAKSDAPTPLLVFIHGGGFSAGGKEQVAAPLIEDCLKNGISVAAINYRLSPEHHFPDHYMDSARAIQFLRSKAKEYNLDPNRVAATGGSAGAGTSLWIAFHDDMADPPEYQFSDFANQIDTLQWQNIYATAAPGATFDVWDRSVSTFGVRPLSPDNRAHHVTAIMGGNLPRDSRVTVTATYGRLEQNATLLPYSYNVDQLAVQTLPRATAEGAIDTVHLAADYTISPLRRLNVRAFARSYSLNNGTPSSRWQYVTSDTSNLNGTASFVNKRVSLPYAWDRRNVGIDATWRLPARTSLVVGVEREDVDREFREANTAENVARASLRTRGSRWMTVEVRGLLGVRDGGVYNNTVTHEGYWYTQADGVDNNNPALTFDNHPDMRRYDVSDRARRQVDARVNLTPRDKVALSAYARYRRDDFDSDVSPSQPLLGTTLAERTATSPGDQLGRLEETRTRFGADAYTELTERVSLNAFVNFDRGTAFDRSIEFNENNKANPSTIATAELGPWTRASSQWTADYDDRTWSAGGGLNWQVVPGKATLSADYMASIARTDITYGGFGVTNFDGTPFLPNHQFAFSSPPTVSEDLHIINLRVEVPVGAMTVIAGYTFEHYALDDWMQGSTAPWVEAVGADTLLRDTSRSFQWGNRLFNLGTYLAPNYDAHIGFVGFRYRF